MSKSHGCAINCTVSIVSFIKQLKVISVKFIIIIILFVLLTGMYAVIQLQVVLKACNKNAIALVLRFTNLLKLVVVARAAAT